MDGLPRELAATLRPELPALADEIVAAVRSEIPAYSTGELPPRLRIGVEEALEQFVAMVERGEGPDSRETDRGPGRDVYVGLGRGEQRAGRGLDALLAAYRLGARIAWRRLAEAGSRAGLAPETLYLLAESIFAYIDELSAESAEGHAQEQSAAAGEAQHRRRRVAALLMQSPPADPDVVRAAADEAGWSLPRSLAVAAFHSGDPERLAGRIGADVLGVQADGVACVLVPDPAAPGRRAGMEGALARPDHDGRPRAALGPTVSWQDARVSFERAAETLALAAEGGLEPRGRGPIAADDHVRELLLARERRLLRDLARRLLAPLDELTPAARARLSTTLLSWLRHQGRVAAVAHELGVHPQTVRYRLDRLRELLGEALDQPERRLELELALRAERLEERRAD